MYSKKFRLPISEVRIKKPAKIFSSPFFLIKIFSNKLDHSRFGIIISAAAVKKATIRNFWKRIIADEIKKMADVKKDFLVIVSPKINNASAEEVKKEIRKVVEVAAQSFTTF